MIFSMFVDHSGKWTVCIGMEASTYCVTVGPQFARASFSLDEKPTLFHDNGPLVTEMWEGYPSSDTL